MVSGPFDTHRLYVAGDVVFSTHLSLTTNGRRQSTVFPPSTHADAVALTCCDSMPNRCAKYTGSGVLSTPSTPSTFCPSRWTSTRMHFPPARCAGHSHLT